MFFDTATPGLSRTAGGGSLSLARFERRDAPQASRVASGRRAVHATVLTAELRWAIVTDRKADRSHVCRLREEPRTRLL
jgi:hypothetical protein